MCRPAAAHIGPPPSTRSSMLEIRARRRPLMDGIFRTLVGNGDNADTNAANRHCLACRIAPLLCSGIGHLSLHPLTPPCRVVYLLLSVGDARTYVGATNNLARRCGAPAGTPPHRTI